MVSKASEDLPEPLRPVMTVRAWRGISTLTFFRLCIRAPCTEMRSSMLAAWGGTPRIVPFEFPGAGGREHLAEVVLRVMGRMGGVERSVGGGTLARMVLEPAVKENNLPSNSILRCTVWLWGVPIEVREHHARQGSERVPMVQHLAAGGTDTGRIEARVRPLEDTQRQRQQRVDELSILPARDRAGDRVFRDAAHHSDPRHGGAPALPGACRAP